MEKGLHPLDFFQHKEDRETMKTISEIIGGAQALLPLENELQDCFPEFLSCEHRSFLHHLRVMEGHWPQGSFIHAQRPGRLEVHEAIVVETLKNELVGHVCRDATAIEPSERPVNRKIRCRNAGKAPKEAGTAQERRGAAQRAYFKIGNQIDRSSEESLAALTRRLPGVEKRTHREVFTSESLRL